MIQKIATVAVYVEDQQKALQFWTEKVGFVVHENHPMGPNANWIEVGPKNAETRLVLYPKALMPNWHEMKPSIVFSCDDIFATYQHMAENGVQFIEEPKKMPWGTYARFVDMDGNEFLLKG
jgi:predicted enzyme related to lactoylglutathione lyase